MVESHLVQARWLSEAESFEVSERLMNMVDCIDQGESYMNERSPL